MAEPWAVPTDLTIPQSRTRRLVRDLLIASNDLIDAFPEQIKRRSTQLCVDACVAAIGVLLAFELRFDFAAPANYTRAMCLWALLMVCIRPTTLLLFSSYKSLWRFLQAQHIVELAFVSLLPSLIFLCLCLTSGRGFWIANVPLGVVILEFAIFVTVAIAVRGWRRAAYNEALRIRTECRQASPVSGASLELTLNSIHCLSGRRVTEPNIFNSHERRFDEQFRVAYSERVVLVTGAGGSVGSELARQLSALPISRLVLLDNAENSIFEIEREIKDLRPLANITPVVGDIRDKALLRDIFNQQKPNIVLHAAAYKHVPIMETNASAAVLNNVVGTRNLLDVVIDFACERFLLISSDKAVQPASVMGATKRLAELLVQSRAREYPATRFASVRFGNVLGSRGSVVPIFLKQIANRKPVTITDERMSRYFMSVQEAVHLVLLASTLAQKGEIYALEMGKPVEIIALARKIIEMHGLRPDEDVKIEKIGIRAGEKLQESVCEDQRQVSKTKLSGIYCLDTEHLPDELERHVSELERIALEHRDREVVSKLVSMPIGYTRIDN